MLSMRVFSVFNYMQWLVLLSFTLGRVSNRDKRYCNQRIVMSIQSALIITSGSLRSQDLVVWL